MTDGREDTNGGSSVGGGGGFHRVQAERDLESNWEVDLAHKLEDYLLKICTGEIPTGDDAHIPVNFAEGLHQFSFSFKEFILFFSFN